MMANIDREGTFRGDVLDRGLSISRGGYKQLELQLKATEKYNEQEEVWQPWDFDVCEAQAYLVLFSLDKKPYKNAYQVMKALGWDGVSVSALQTDDKLATKIQFRMAAEEYQGVTKIKVSWVDAYDADPNRKVQKLEASDLSKLDAEFSAACKLLSGGPKPVSAAPTIPAPVKSKRSKKIDMMPPAPPVQVTEPMLMEDAWGTCYKQAKAAGKTDIEIGQAWTEAVKAAGGDDSAVQDWSAIASGVLQGFETTS